MAGEQVRFGVLGPLLVERDGQGVELPRSLVVRGLLGVLLLARGAPLAVERLAELVWEVRAGRIGRGAVQVGVSRLRNWLESAGLGSMVVVEHSSAGYRLGLCPGAVDLDLFHDRVGRAERVEDPTARCELLSSALGLLRGPVLADVPGLDAADPLLASVRAAIREAGVALGVTALEAGRAEAAAAPLEVLVDAYPLDEPLHARLIEVLAACGRPSEALRRYELLRGRLAEELGVDPSEEVQRAHLAVLLRDRELAGESSWVQSAWCLLPPDIADFTGRDAQVGWLERLLTHGSGDRATAVPISAVVGKAGIGKTTLAVHVAHRLRDRFPDGQLYVDLGGSRSSDPAEVLDWLLRVLGLHGAAVPAGLEERSGLYRSVLAGRRVLVVLDNAVSETQVLPLLPGDPSCGVVVTSRQRLGGLPGIRLLELDLLEPEQSIQLLGHIAGRPRVAGEMQAARELARLCGYLPLALRIAGARLATRPHWTLGQLVDRLADERQRLDELAHGHLEVRASLALSCQTLPPAVQTMFGRLGLLDAPDVAAWAGAALLDAPVEQARELLDGLADAQLADVITQDGQERRYRSHDLIRVYAREQAEATEAAEQRASALARALAGWLALAELAHRRAYGGDYGVIHGTAVRWLPDPEHAEALVADPMAWFERERLAIAAAIRQAAEQGLDELCWDLAATCEPFYGMHSYLDDWRESYEHALAVTVRAGNRRGQAVMAFHVGDLHLAQGRLDEAVAYHQRAQGMFEEMGDRHGYAMTLHSLATAERQSARFEDALRHGERARAILHEVGDRGYEAHTLRGLAQVYMQLGRDDRAERYLAEALAISSAVGARRVQAQILFRVGELNLRRGQLRQAEDAFQSVLDYSREARDRRGQGYALLGLGQVRLQQGHNQPSRAHLEMALRMATETSSYYLTAQVLLAMGEAHRERGCPRQAIDHFRQALALCRDNHLRAAEAQVLAALNAAGEATGDHRLPGQTGPKRPRA